MQNSDHQIYVTRPDLPDLDGYFDLVKQIWENKWLTNSGEMHKRLEYELADFLGVESIALFCNGTLALMAALRAFHSSGKEIITTPFTFAATVHSIDWVGATPVFCDIDPISYNLDATKVESLITSRTAAILPVHVYGQPCDVEAFEEIGRKHGLPVIYDAAHAFNVRYKNRSILEYGDASILSFHATKVFSTVEGGAVVPGDKCDIQTLELLKNFGIKDENTIVLSGINAKMNELQAAYGLSVLPNQKRNLECRKQLYNYYSDRLECVSGIQTVELDSDTDYNYSYYPIRVDAAEYGICRDELYDILKRDGIHARKYFSPLLSSIKPYEELPSANPEKLPVANMVAQSILCLPLYASLQTDDVAMICTKIKERR